MQKLNQIVLVFLALFLISCSNNENNSTGSNSSNEEKKLDGKWQALFLVL